MEKFSLAEDVLIQQVDNQSVVVSPSGGMITSINATGTLLLMHLDSKGESSLNELLDAVVAEYDVSANLLKNDVIEFINEMKTANIII